jgi:PAS domain S-box-containing protein
VGSGDLISSFDDGKRLSESAVSVAASPGLQLVYDTAPVGLAFLSTDCRYMMINQHLTEICGISIADHLGRSVRDTVPQVAEQVEQIVQTIVRSGESITGIEINGQRSDGSNVDRVWITYWHPLKNQTGEVIGINVAAEEVTERKRSDADRAAMQERLWRLNDTLADRVEAEAQERDRLWKLSQDLLIVTDSDGTILNANPAWTDTLGWTPDDLIGKTGEWLIHPDDRERSLEELIKLRSGQPAPQFENRIRCRDGSYRWLSWRAMSDRSSVYAIARDISDFKQTQEQLHTLRRELAQVSRQTTMGAMTGSIAHEIRQPLAAIATNANAGLRWLKRASPDLDEAQAAFDRVIKETHRIDEVIESIRATLGGKPSEKSSVDIRSLVAEAVVLTKNDLDSHQILLRNEVSDGLLAVVGNRVQLQQVLVNLITNAIDAMSTVRERERRLAIAAISDGQDVTITIEYTGSGIDTAKSERIFEPFFTTKSEGMGLGLSICQSIIEAHGGRLWALPRSPFGTAFHITLSAAGGLERD